MLPLFTVWHAYQHAVCVVYHSFLPVCTYLLRGAHPDGTKVPMNLKVRSMELLFAALLMIPASDVNALQGAAQQAQRDYEAKKAVLEALVLQWSQTRVPWQLRVAGLASRRRDQQLSWLPRQSNVPRACTCS